MSKYHYIITANKRLREENKSNGTKTVTISEVTEVKENGKATYDSYSIKKGNKDTVFNCLMGCAVIDCLVMAFLIVIAKDILKLENNLYLLSSDFVAASGLLSLIYSFSKPREFIGKIFFRYGENGNKLFVSFITFFLALIIAIFLFIIGLKDRFSNLVSVFCVIISLKNLQ
ncbi:MAG: hypothetical protein HDR19_03185 [Lachnospiraceae bacterium]|nr:hypothetical protein [Lachnospiraceae bacterium]